MVDETMTVYCWQDDSTDRYVRAVADTLEDAMLAASEEIDVMYGCWPELAAEWMTMVHNEPKQFTTPYAETWTLAE